jgi:hypothetical protein
MRLDTSGYVWMRFVKFRQLPSLLRHHELDSKNQF